MTGIAAESGHHGHYGRPGPPAVEIARIAGVSRDRVRYAPDSLEHEGRIRREPPSLGPGVREATVAGGERTPGGALLAASESGRPFPDEPVAWSLIEDAATPDEQAFLPAIRAAVEGHGDPKAAELALRFLRSAFRTTTEARQNRGARKARPQPQAASDS
ncbi:MAG: hypothetical protein OXG37_11460 [Actinomycetia bacterium]|nr:hypothetical protein [Actinomycetes bacterium]